MATSDNPAVNVGSLKRARPGWFTRSRGGALAVIACALSLWMVSNAVAAEVGSESAAVAKPAADGMMRFREFLDDPPWIRFIRYRVSGNQFFVTSQPLKGEGRRVQLGGWLRFEGALQPTGFYLRYPSNSAEFVVIPPQGPISFNSVPSGMESVIGASRQYYWQLQQKHTQIFVAPASGELGAAENNVPQQNSVSERRQWLERIQHLGIHALGGEPLRWLDEANFEAHSEDYGLVKAVITDRFHDGLPKRIEYSYGIVEKFHNVLEYDYDENRSLPPKRIILIWNDYINKSRITTTNIIDEWEPGLDSAVHDGYRPTDFLREPTPVADMQFWSNGVRYAVDRSGKLNVLPDAIPNYGTLGIRTGTAVYSAILVLIVFMAVSLAILGLRIAKRKK